MDAPTIPVHYWCKACGLEDIVVNVPERGVADDVRLWFEQVMTPALVGDHGTRSPACHPREFTKVAIPMDGRPLIGGRVEH